MTLQKKILKSKIMQAIMVGPLSELEKRIDLIFAEEKSNVVCSSCDYWNGKTSSEGGTGQGRCSELSWLVNSFDKVKGCGIHFDKIDSVKVSITTDEDFFCGKFIDKSRRPR